MKKRYEKPVVVIETLQLSQSIAACFYKLNSANVGECETVVNIGDFVWGEAGTFVKENLECTNESETYCYTEGTGTYATYMS